MANTLTGGREYKISKIVQAYLNKTLVSKAITDFSLESTLVKGQSINKPYRSNFAVGDYSVNTDVTPTDVTITQELLTVDKSKYVSMVYDPVENAQIEYELQTIFAPQMAHVIKNHMDQDTLSEISNASLSLDDGNFGGSASTPIPLTNSDSYAEIVFGKAYATIMNNCDESKNGLYAVIDPFTADQIGQRAMNLSGYQQGDSSFSNGYRGDFQGFKVYVSNNLPTYVSLVTSQQVSADDTISINGVTFTFKASPSVAGEVDIGTDAAGSTANLVAAINGGAGAGTAYIALSGENRRKLSRTRVVATDNTTSIGITAAGKMSLVEALTHATNVFGDQSIYCHAGQVGAISMVTQLQPRVEINKNNKNLGYTAIAHSLYGLKTFAEGAGRLCKVRVKAL